MNARQTSKRLAKLEGRLLPSGDGLFTLEELSRAAWREDKKRYRQAAESCRIFRIFMPQFEQEDTVLAAGDAASIYGP